MARAYSAKVATTGPLALISSRRQSLNSPRMPSSRQTSTTAPLNPPAPYCAAIRDCELQSGLRNIPLLKSDATVPTTNPEERLTMSNWPLP